MKQIRRNIFETNSSSAHSLTMCTQVDWLNWERGSLVFDNWNDELVPKGEIFNDEEYEEYEEYDEEYRYFNNPEEYFNWAVAVGYETFKQNFRNVIAFGYVGGHD